MMYSDEVMRLLSKKGIAVGDVVEIDYEGRHYKGILLESPSSVPTDILVLKLPNGYNVGVKANDSIQLCERAAPVRPTDKHKVESAGAQAVALMFGGTISSKVEYRTGAVFPSATPAEFAEAFPEARGKCSFKSVTSILSEDVCQAHWKVMGLSLIH
ncbi:MAG: hypothetical protein N3H30_02695, partial [Candidatus Micrarchaeota archaeon]|nr:hypothetical protein [Candidatus Micrarchaeota archaeon]